MLVGLGIGRNEKADAAVAAGVGAFFGVAALGVPLTIVGAQRVPPAGAVVVREPEARLKLVVSPGSAALVGAF